jgi:hypothetical protein
VELKGVKRIRNLIVSPGNLLPDYLVAKTVLEAYGIDCNDWSFSSQTLKIVKIQPMVSKGHKSCYSILFQKCSLHITSKIIV